MHSTPDRKTFTVLGATSDTGRLVADSLAAAGHDVRRVSRRHGVSLDDSAALKAAFAGADGAYLMMPFDLLAPDLHARERALAAQIAAALQGSGVHRAVVLSGLSAELKRGSSLGAALLEDAVRALGLPEAVFLRAGWFMENFTKGLNFPAQAAGGVFATPFEPHRPLPMVSAADVASRVAELLQADPLPAETVQELLGAADLSMAEATVVMAQAIGRLGVRYEQASPADARAGMLAAGMSPSFADAVLETARSFNEGEPWGSQPRTARNTTPTTLAHWARQAFSLGQAR
jgi:uncharacterized protein YbjT (DUF2867 family)